MSNYIQVACGILAVILIFAGLFTVVRKLAKSGEKKRADTDTVIRSTVLILVGLLSFAVTRTCTNLASETSEEYSLITVYLASLIEVVKSFGFILLVPLVLNLLTPKQREEKAEEQTSEN